MRLIRHEMAKQNGLGHLIRKSGTKGQEVSFGAVPSRVRVRGTRRSRGLKLGQQPRTREPPITFDGDRSDYQHLGHFFLFQPPKNRSSTTCAARGASWFKRSSASFTTNKSSN